MTIPVILFACIHNGGRSLAAKVLTAHYGGDAVEVRPAGAEPGCSPNPSGGGMLHERCYPPPGRSPAPPPPRATKGMRRSRIRTTA